MRQQDPLIVGAGPAGLAAAIVLAQQGRSPLVVERSARQGDALCGGFVSWRTLAQLERLGIDPATLGGHPVRHVRIVAGRHVAEAELPGGAMGISRRTMDGRLRDRALSLGVEIRTGANVKAIADGEVRIADGSAFSADAIFLASGKHDIKGHERPRDARDPSLGLRLRIMPDPTQRAALVGTIELHLFDRGYAGIVLQEGGSANIAIALRKSRIGAAGSSPRQLLSQLGALYPCFGERIAALADDTVIDAIAAVPYGWRARTTRPGLFRIGDQAAVIPSLAGEGNGIALASGVGAANAYLDGGAAAAPGWQEAFARAARRPVGLARLVWSAAERPAFAAAATATLRHIPLLTGWIAAQTRIGH